MPRFSYSRPTMKPEMFCKKTSGIPRWLHSSMKCAPLSADSLNRMPLLATIPTGCPQMCAKARHQGLAVELLELLEAGAVDDAADHLADVVGRAGVGRDDVVERLRVERRLLDGPQVVRRGSGPREGVDDAAHDRERVGVVLGQVVDDAGGAGVDIAATQLLGRDDLPGRGLHQGRAAEEDRALVAHDHGLV